MDDAIRRKILTLLELPVRPRRRRPVPPQGATSAKGKRLWTTYDIVYTIALTAIQAGTPRTPVEGTVEFKLSMT
jgi:hypothetical protein